MSRISGLFLVIILLISTSFAKPPTRDIVVPSQATFVDYQTYIDGNKLLMFVSNIGHLAYDMGGILNRTDGLYYPYTGIQEIQLGNTPTVIYSSGLWLGGFVNNVFRGAAAEYSSDYTPGPMSGGVPLPDRESFRCYKLYYDSLANNPNNDYLNWPTDQGAPTNPDGTPQLLGKQTVWTVFNSANTSNSTIGFNTLPLGVEIHQTVWNEFPNIYDSFHVNTGVNLTITESENIIAVFEVFDAKLVSLDSFQISLTDTIYQTIDTTWNLPESTVNSIDTTEQMFMWHLDNINTGENIFANQHPGKVTTDMGFNLTVTAPFNLGKIREFAVVANGAGVVDPHESAGAPWYDYPVPTGVDPDGYPTDGQQVGAGSWLIATGDNGGTNGGGDRGSYEAFIDRTFREASDGGARLNEFGQYDWEIRFTGDISNPEVGGSYAWNWATDQLTVWVPFEIWRIGIDTPDDPSDDVRLLPYLFDDGNQVFDLSSYGSDSLGNCSPGGCEHSISGGDNDPYTGDWLYWRIPADTSSGESGYFAFEAEMLSNPASRVDNAAPVMDRMVFVNWNGGMQPPFTQDMPEQGTVFRISTGFGFVQDSLIFNYEPTNEPTHVYAPLDDFAVYLRYILYNKSNNNIDSMYLGIWSDPDLGGAGDDVVGCDSISSIGFCYNANYIDGSYGNIPPAIGYKIIHGPLVPAPGETGFFNSAEISDYKNLPMTAFMKYISGEDPHTATEFYRVLKGLYGYSDQPIIDPTTGDPTTFIYSGDPVTGTGWLDENPADRRMTVSCGPFDMAPGDSQYVLIKIAVGHDKDHLSSITALRNILNQPYQIPTDIKDGNPPSLPTKFALDQNYPNPFNPTTNISFDLPSKADVNISIFNILGQKVKTLVNQQLPAGSHEIEWDGTNNIGEKVSSGIYLYKLTTDKNSASKKMVLLK